MSCRCDSERYKTYNCKHKATTSQPAEHMPRAPKFVGNRNVRTYFNWLERFYENCATFNMKYCPFPGVIEGRNSLKIIQKDFAILFFFMITNFVVLFVIISRMTLHLLFLTIQTIDWILRYHFFLQNLHLLLLSILRVRFRIGPHTFGVVKSGFRELMFSF